MAAAAAAAAASVKAVGTGRLGAARIDFFYDVARFGPCSRVVGGACCVRRGASRALYDDVWTY